MSKLTQWGTRLLNESIFHCHLHKVSFTVFYGLGYSTDLLAGNLLMRCRAASNH